MVQTYILHAISNCVRPFTLLPHYFCIHQQSLPRHEYSSPLCNDHVLGFQQVHYFINHFWERHFPSSGPVGEFDCWRIRKNCVTFICFIVLFVVTGVSVGLSYGMSLALLTLLPITNAIDNAPNRLYVIYQASVKFFATLIAFQVIFQHNNSPFAFLIKAQEMACKGHFLQPYFHCRNSLPL